MYTINAFLFVPFILMLELNANLVLVVKSFWTHMRKMKHLD
ncbi:hypothetical protein HanIR_Chr16g0815861 [Helianthus annuus]|nr:hypothetical protein HanIR_Chr16g0815861 [Helianthus annuus]